MPMSAFGLGRGRPVAAGSTPSKLISAKSSASTNTSITRTGLLSSMKSSRHSGNSVHCPRSASSTKRLINSPTESRENHNSSTAFSHSQGQTRTLRLSGRMSVLPPRTDIERPLRHVRFVPGKDALKLRGDYVRELAFLSGLSWRFANIKRNSPAERAGALAPSQQNSAGYSMTLTI